MKVANYYNSPLVRGFMATVIGSGGSKIIMILATFICTNMLEQAAFGQFSFVRNTLNMVLVMCALNYAGICTKFTSECMQYENARARLLLVFIFSLLLCAIIGVAIYIIPDSTLIEWFKDNSVVYFFRISAVLLPIFIINPLAEGVLRGLFRFKLIGLVQTATSVCFVGLLYMGIKLWGLSGAMYALLAYYTLGSVTMVLCLLEYHPVKFFKRYIRHIYKESKILVTIIGPIFITSFIEAPIFWIAQLILMRYSNYGSVGSMTAIMQIRNLAILLPTYFFSTFIAFAGRLNAEGNYDEYYSKFRKLGQQTFLCGSIMSSILIILGHYVLRLYGSEYVNDYLPYVMSCLALPLLLMSNLYKISLVLRERQRQLMVISISWNIIWLSLLFVCFKIETLPSLFVFFSTQLVGCMVQFYGIKYVFNKDKKRLCKK